MHDSNIPVQSLKSLFISTISALFLATIILFTVVLPAEYGIDPTGLGKAIGLTALANPAKASVEVATLEIDQESPTETIALAPQPESTIIIPDINQELVIALPATPVEQAVKTPVISTAPITKIPAQTAKPSPPTLAVAPKPKPSTSPSKTVKPATKPSNPSKPKKPSSTWQDTAVITVPAGVGLEYKFHMQKNAKLSYTWKTNGAKLYYDFHGEPAGDTTGYFKSYQEKTGSQSSGNLTTPFTGVHGWYWENNTKSTVKITLKTKGKYKIKGLI